MMYEYVNFSNVGYIIMKFTDEQLSPIWEEVREIQSDFNKCRSRAPTLAGHIKQEYDLPRSRDHIDSLVRPYIGAYEHQFGYSKNINLSNDTMMMQLDKPWVNFQKKHEFNPIHDHAGVYSFTIWLQLPFDIADERAVFPEVTYNSAGCFNFHFTDALGDIRTMNIQSDRSKQGHGLLFPAKMKHSVNPFYTSDEFRISIAGNYKYKSA